jgi:type VI secretion system protein ImpK
MTVDRHALSDLFNEFYLLGNQIRSKSVQLPDADQLKNRLLNRFEAARKQALALGFTPAEVDDAQYAVAAFLDEVIQFSDWPGKQQLRTAPLQRMLFSESIAGENFFERLAAARRKESPSVEVYFHCIVLGFRGQYHIGDKEELGELIEDLRQELIDEERRAISPHGGRPEDDSVITRRFPFIPVAIGSLFLALLVIVVLYFILASQRSDVVETLKAMGRQ